MKVRSIQSSPASCSFLLFRSKCSPQYHVLKRPQCVLQVQNQRKRGQIYTPIRIGTRLNHALAATSVVSTWFCVIYWYSELHISKVNTKQKTVNPVITRQAREQRLDAWGTSMVVRTIIRMGGLPNNIYQNVVILSNVIVPSHWYYFVYCLTTFETECHRAVIEPFVTVSCENYFITLFLFFLFSPYFFISIFLRVFLFLSLFKLWTPELTNVDPRDLLQQGIETISSTAVVLQLEILSL